MHAWSHVDDGGKQRQTALSGTYLSGSVTATAELLSTTNRSRAAQNAIVHMVLRHMLSASLHALMVGFVLLKKAVGDVC